MASTTPQEKESRANRTAILRTLQFSHHLRSLYVKSLIRRQPECTYFLEMVPAAPGLAKAKLRGGRRPVVSKTTLALERRRKRIPHLLLYCYYLHHHHHYYYYYHHLHHHHHHHHYYYYYYHHHHHHHLYQNRSIGKDATSKAI